MDDESHVVAFGPLLTRLPDMAWTDEAHDIVKESGGRRVHPLPRAKGRESQKGQHAGSER